MGKHIVSVLKDGAARHYPVRGKHADAVREADARFMKKLPDETVVIMTLCRRCGEYHPSYVGCGC